jgi:hypothetical protein
MIDFELEDIDGRRRRLSEFRGRPVVLAVAGREAGEAAARFGATLGAELGDSDAVVVTVADAGGVPRLMRGMVRGLFRSGLERAQRQAAVDAPDLPPDAWDRFVMLLDWEGVGLDALGLRGRTGRYHVLVLNRQGKELGRVVQGGAPPDAQLDTVLDWLDEA